MAKSVRQSNLELLRIFAILGIILGHYSSFSFIGVSESNAATLAVFNYWAHIGVDIFVLISGYFLCKQEFSIRKPLKLWVQATAVSLIILLCFMLSGKHFSLRQIASALFPIIYGEWWFVTSYFVLLLLWPFLNKLISALTKKELLTLIAILTCITVVLPTFLSARMASGMLILFINLYLIAAYIRLYPMQIIDRRGCFWLYIALAVDLFFLLVMLIEFRLGKTIGLLANRAVYFDATERVWTMLRAVLYLIAFKNLNMKPSNLINFIGSSVFGVYLIHSSLYINDIWWTAILKGPAHIESAYMPLHALAAVIITFSSCVILDVLYRYCIDKPLWKLIDRSLERRKLLRK